MKLTYSSILRIHVALLMSVSALAQGAMAQGNSAVRLLAPSTGEASQNTVAKENGKVASTQEAREQLLTERIEALERRLAELEARLQTAPVPVANGLSVSEQQASRVPVTSLSAGPSNTKSAEPFAFADWSWLTGNSRTKDLPLDSRVFTGEFRADVAYHHDFNHPKDNTIGGSSEVFRSGEFQLTHLGIGGDFHYNNVRGRILTQLGMYSQTQPRNDPSTARGQWNLDNAYRYMTEAYGGYHFDKMHGINVDAGMFLSYIGLWSFYNFDNWTYQPSYVSSNTPWFFTGVRVQFFPTEKLKIEPWLVNGWQTYGKFNKAPGVGGQVLWRPNGSVSLVLNHYFGTDTLGNPGRKRFHSDNSIQVKYLDRPNSMLDKAAFSVTVDLGCEFGGGVKCHGGNVTTPSQFFAGFMAYNRFWFHKDLFGLTIGGGAITNPGRYLVLLPPINGATAFSGTPYFTANPGDTYRAWDASVTFDYMPSQFITWRWEYNHRATNVPYFSGPGGVTPPGGNVGPPGSLVPGFAPDLRKFERRMTFAVLVKM